MTAIAGHIHPPTVPEQIAALLALRLRVADQTRELAGRELRAREIRWELEQELTTTSKAEGEKRAKVHPRYIAFEESTIQLAHQRDETLAHAETARLEILMHLQAAALTGGAS